MSGRPVAVPMLYCRCAFGALLLDWAECRWDCIVDLTPASASCCLTSSPQQPVCCTALCEGRHYSRRFSPTISILWHGCPMVFRCFIQSWKKPGMSPDMTALIGVQHQHGEMNIGPEKRLCTIPQPCCGKASAAVRFLLLTHSRITYR